MIAHLLGVFGVPLASRDELLLLPGEVEHGARLHVHDLVSLVGGKHCRCCVEVCCGDDEGGEFQGST